MILQKVNLILGASDNFTSIMPSLGHTSICIKTVYGGSLNVSVITEGTRAVKERPVKNCRSPGRRQGQRCAVLTCKQWGRKSENDKAQEHK